MRDLVLNKLQTNKGIVKSYSPTINKELEEMKSHSPQKGMYHSISDKKVCISDNECVGWSTRKAKEAMLNNLTSKKPIDFKKVVAPKQLKSNCWFNVFFMVFFISDKGRSFFRHLREMMITGLKSVDKEPIDKGLKWPFFQLNRAADASLRGDVFAKEMDTNKVIASISRKIKTVAKVGKASNPLDFYKSMIEYLNNEPFRIEHYYNDALLPPINPKLDHPHLIIHEYTDMESGKRRAPLQIDHASGSKYRLENVVLRNTDKRHFACFLTCGKKEWAFDGYSYSRMSEFDWKKKINEDYIFEFNDYTISDKMKFNFKKGYQLLFYYRIK
tara:strand:- start:1265 stop:2251 length:987 start_codon:yes stop_codon:yes gene_type:complete